MKISSFEDISKNYDLFLLDLWGVIHDGTNLYPGVIEFLYFLKENNKKVHFISNGPRRSEKAIVTLQNLNVSSNLYNALTTSGETFYQYLKKNLLTHIINPKDKNYYFIGTTKDLGMIDDLGYQKIENINEANFILNHGPFFDERDRNIEEEVFKPAIKDQKIMICVNPDLVVVKQTGEVIDCAGKLAEKYIELGGKVQYFGKPYKEIYEYIVTEYKFPLNKVLAVGDSFYTDILGANNYGIDSCLVTQGIFAKDVGSNISDEQVLQNYNKLCVKYKAKPTYVIHDFKEFKKYKM
ncbi:MAG: TIGR01459 family HAD-type hydrolase [Sphingobacteriia bacterium]|nr:TIGR01459 family HAD-type hydrolase [Sphingobacteriia bacterium]